jgi:drug/metabolite transporter (DMT)-like permease
MATIALAVALLSAVMHATWNFFLKDSEDRLATAALMITCGAVIYLPWVYAIEGPPVGVWRYLAVSGVIHASYNVALVTAYDRLDFSVAYPMARGIAPALVALGGWLFLGDSLGWAATLALGLVVAALMWLAWAPRASSMALRATADRTGHYWALLTGMTIALYTVNDAAAVRESGRALSYTVTMMAANAVLLVPYTIRRRGVAALLATARSRPVALVGAAALNVGAYALVLFAATRAPVGLVAAVRETSVVIGALAGVVLLKEPFGRRRLTGAVAVAVGIAVLGIV